jgi:hypothetical protein
MFLHGVDFTWLLRLPMWGVDVDGLAFFLHHPTACSRQTRGQGLLSGIAFSRRVVVGSSAFPGDAKPLRLDIG